MGEKMIICTDSNSHSGGFIAFAVKIPSKQKSIRITHDYYYIEEIFCKFMDEDYLNGIGPSEKEAVTDFFNKNNL